MPLHTTSCSLGREGSSTVHSGSCPTHISRKFTSAVFQIVQDQACLPDLDLESRSGNTRGTVLKTEPPPQMLPPVVLQRRDNGKGGRQSPKNQRTRSWVNLLSEGNTIPGWPAPLSPQPFSLRLERGIWSLIACSIWVSRHVGRPPDLVKASSGCSLEPLSSSEEK